MLNHESSQGVNVVSKSRVYLDLVEDVPGYVVIKAPYAEKDAVKAVPGRSWVPKRKSWEIPLESIPDAMRIFPFAQMSPELKEMLEEQTARIRAKIEAKDKINDDLVIPGLKDGMKLYGYQNTGVGFLDLLQLFEGSILAYDMGLGKSLTSLAYALKMIAEGRAKYLMVICPATLKYATWEKEIKKFFPGTEYVVVDGSRKVAVEEEDGSIVKLKGQDLREVQYLQYLNGVPIIITNYELFLHDCECRRVETYVRNLKESEKTVYQTEAAMAVALHVTNDMDDEKAQKMVHTVAELAALKKAVGESKTAEYCIKTDPVEGLQLFKVDMFDIIPDLDKDWIVVLDEAHRIKNPRASTTKNLVRKVKGAGYKVLGTGTPLENNIEELWQLVELCRPGLLGNWFQFKQRYIETDMWGKILGPIRERLPELRQRLEPIMIRKTKEEALPDLPPLTTVDRWVEMTKAQRVVYEEVRKGILEKADGEFNYLEVLAQITRFQQVCDSPALLNEYLERELPEDSGKLKELPVLLSEINPSRNKVILFTQYREMALIIRKKLAEWYPGYYTAFIAGGVSDIKRRDEQLRFQEDDNCRFIVITTAGNYGLDLYAGNYVIAFDETFNPQKMEQVYSRAHRNGQQQPVTAINMRTFDSYEERKAKMLESKRGVFAAMIDGDDSAFAKLFEVKELVELF